MFFMKANSKSHSAALKLNKRTVDVLKQNGLRKLQGGITGKGVSQYSTECDKNCCPKSVATAESYQPTTVTA
jgi:hypothetical protein